MTLPKPKSDKKKQKRGNWFWDFLNSGDGSAELLFCFFDFLYKISFPILLEGIAIAAETATLIITVTAEAVGPIAELLLSMLSSF